MRKGGAFLANGANTCVYDPPLECLDGTKVDDPTKYVSRVVYGDDDLYAQMMVKEIVDKVEAKYPGQIRNRFNFYEKACKKFEVKESDIRNKEGKNCEITDFGISRPETVSYLTNIITPKQQEDVYSKDQISRRNKVVPELFELMRVLARIEGKFVHLDLHFGNIAWKDDKLVIHDFGLAETNDHFQYRFHSIIGDRTSSKFEYANKFVQWKMGAVLGYNAQVRIGLSKTLERLARVFDILSIIMGMQQYDLIDKIEMKLLTNEFTEMLVNDFTTEHLINVLNFHERDILSTKSPVSSSPPREVKRIRLTETKHAPSPAGGGKGTRPANKFCRCITHVQKTGKTESSAIAICVRSVIPAARTLKKFRCKRKATLITQRRLTRRRK
jgi:hypothetical protein